MKNVNLTITSFRDGKEVTNFDVSNTQKQSDGTIKADLWCTHGCWHAKAVFNENKTVDVKIKTTGRKLTYHSYEVVS